MLLLLRRTIISNARPARKSLIESLKAVKSVEAAITSLVPSNPSSKDSSTTAAALGMPPRGTKRARGADPTNAATAAPVQASVAQPDGVGVGPSTLVVGQPAAAPGQPSSPSPSTAAAQAPSPPPPASPTAAPLQAPATAPTPTPSKKRPKPLPAAPSFPPGSLLQLRAKALRIQQQLDELYPAPPIPLHHGSAFQLLVAVMLSAQSTDAKVNTVTPELFTRGPDAAAMAALEVAEIERIIRVLGLAPTKAKNVQRMSQVLVAQYGGQVPDNFPALEDLPGVGHKTASVVMSQAFGHAAFPVDTHIHRLAQRWGLSNGKSVEQTEQDLKTLLPEHAWRDVHLQMIYFGRERCPAQRHDAVGCPICSWAAATAGRAVDPAAGGDGGPSERTVAAAAVAAAAATRTGADDAAPPPRRRPGRGRAGAAAGARGSSNLDPDLHPSPDLVDEEAGNKGGEVEERHQARVPSRAGRSAAAGGGRRSGGAAVRTGQADGAAAEAALGSAEVGGGVGGPFEAFRAGGGTSSGRALAASASGMGDAGTHRQARRRGSRDGGVAVAGSCAKGAEPAASRPRSRAAARKDS